MTSACAIAVNVIKEEPAMLGYSGSREPSIKDLLDDPIAELVRRRDNLTREAVSAFIDEAKRKLRRRGAARPPQNGA